jgi:hypothetical protein
MCACMRGGCVRGVEGVGRPCAWGLCLEGSLFLCERALGFAVNGGT